MPYSGVQECTRNFTKISRECSCQWNPNWLNGECYLFKSAKILHTRLSNSSRHSLRNWSNNPCDFKLLTTSSATLSGSFLGSFPLAAACCWSAMIDSRIVHRSEAMLRDLRRNTRSCRRQVDQERKRAVKSTQVKDKSPG